jgi:DNA-binding XRE family transcriptional regulator
LIDVANGKPKNLIVLPRRAAFAERIKALREAAGLTQTELAKRAGIDRSYYAEVEAGQHSVSIDIRYRAPALHDPRRRPHPRHGRRAHRRAGHPRRAPAAGGAYADLYAAQFAQPVAP